MIDFGLAGDLVAHANDKYAGDELYYIYSDYVCAGLFGGSSSLAVSFETIGSAC